MTAQARFIKAFILSAAILTAAASPTWAVEVLSINDLAGGRTELLSSLNNWPRAKLEQMNYLWPGDTIESATLGEPFAYYRLETEMLRSLEDYGLFKKCLTFIMWDIPVSFGGPARLLLGMAKVDGRWQLAHYGKDPTFIVEARSRWPKSEGYVLSYVMEVGGPAFIMVEQKDSIWLCPLFERNERLLGVKKDSSGQYPLLTIPYVAKKLQARKSICPAPRMQ